MSRRRRSAPGTASGARSGGRSGTAALLRAGLVAAAAGLALPASASQGSPVPAYIDPGAGSFILQAIVASVAGAAVAVSAYWRRIKRFFGIGNDADPVRETNPSRDD